MDGHAPHHPTARALCRGLRFSHAGSGHPAQVAVMAEVGVNHDGSEAMAIDLVHRAAMAGADAVKFQCFSARNLLSNQAGLAQYQKSNAPRGDDRAQLRQMLRRLELSLKQLESIRNEAAQCGVAFVVTPFTPQDVSIARDLDVDAVKIASPDAVNTPLLDAAAALGVPMLISTGACELGELTEASSLLRTHRAGGAMLHCVSSYPTALAEASLGAIEVLRRQFRLAVGYSDHTVEVETAGLAVAAGACLLEKHLTHDCHAVGPDHGSSLEPKGFAQYVQAARRVAQAVGPSCKSVLPCEQDVRQVSRQSVCVTRDLPAGHVLKSGDLTVKRPGTGIPAGELWQVVGRMLGQPVMANDLLQLEHLAGPACSIEAGAA